MKLILCKFIAAAGLTLIVPVPVPGPTPVASIYRCLDTVCRPAAEKSICRGSKKFITPIAGCEPPAPLVEPVWCGVHITDGVGVSAGGGIGIVTAAYCAAAATAAVRWS